MASEAGTRIPAPALVVFGLLGLQGGAALSTVLFPLVGASGVVTLRLAGAALVLLVWTRSFVWPEAQVGWLIAACGALLCVHHLAYYTAVSRLPLGMATTLEFIGPLMLALSASRGARDIAAAGLAALGVLALTGNAWAAEPIGITCGLVAGACWASYIVLSKKLAHGERAAFRLGLVMVVGALLSLPLGIGAGGTALLQPTVLAVGLGVAVMSSVMPYGLQLIAIRRLSPGVFGVLVSLEPAIGALVGLVALGQALDVTQWAGVIAVAAASILATRR
ncbi:EamA family transporter [Endozoicomonas sp. G2_2]|uniref:EamA family transporter n=1 Tax=Endozoicomonas sp. G2_2 TaxID=2821092 RepID=UPI001ADB9739|nr:EamA family transporter [Endozoicomonas sp. G2_2]